MKVIAVGRAAGNDVVISDPLVGRRHLEIIQDDAGAFFVRDLDSTNGTFVNGTQISGEVPLEPHDIIRIGGTTLSWGSYFLQEEDKKSRRRRRKKKEREERPAKKERGGRGGMFTWILRSIITTAITIFIMQLIYRMMR